MRQSSATVVKDLEAEIIVETKQVLLLLATLSALATDAGTGKKVGF